jgi:hypothetical protein
VVHQEGVSGVQRSEVVDVAVCFFFKKGIVSICTFNFTGPYESYRDEPKRAGSPGSNERDGLVYNDYGVRASRGVRSSMSRFAFSLRKGSLVYAHVGMGRISHLMDHPQRKEYAEMSNFNFTGPYESYRDEPKRAGCGMTAFDGASRAVAVGTCAASVRYTVVIVN